MGEITKQWSKPPRTTLLWADWYKPNGLASEKKTLVRWSPKGQGLLRKAILSQNLVFLRSMHFLKGFQRKSSCFLRAFNERHPSCEELSTKVSLLLKSFQQKSACLCVCKSLENHKLPVSLNRKNNAFCHKNSQIQFVLRKLGGILLRSPKAS